MKCSRAEKGRREEMMEVDKMNRVRRALEICKKPSCSCRDNDGTKCPYSEKVVCVDTLCGDAAELIDELIAERDEWKRRAEAAEKDIKYMLITGEDCPLCGSSRPECGWDCELRAKWRGPCAENGGVNNGRGV